MKTMRPQRSPLRDLSPSPPPPQQQTTAPPLTKRDVRRQRITDRLTTMSSCFDANQYQHYRTQLSAVQVDMNLVMRADLTAGPLEDDGESVRAAVEETGVHEMLPEEGEGSEGVRRDYWALAGKRYGEFCGEVNDCLEGRDGGLVALHNNYNSSIADLDRLTLQKLHQAEQEHQALASTIRQRLISSLTKKRQQLLRDKEQLDIAADNPLLLHPNHFSINNPGSPGNGTANRKTRHLRHRAGSPAPGDLEANGTKRKRKHALLEEEGGNESPAPGSYKPLRPPPDALGGGRSPFKDARDKSAYAQFEAPAYSLERIFTEKELAMATDVARTATYKHFNQPPADHDTKASSNSNPTAVPSLDGERDPNTDAASTVLGESEFAAAPTTEGTPPPVPAAAPEMERSASHQVLTRGTVRANPLAALDALADVAAGRNGNESSLRSLQRERDPFAPVLPPNQPVMRSEKVGAPTPNGISGMDLENDLRLMRTLANNSSNAANASDRNDAMDVDGEDDDPDSPTTLRRTLLDQALSTHSTGPPYRLPLMEQGGAGIGKVGVERIAATGFAPVATYLEQQAKNARAVPTSAAAMLGVAGSGGGRLGYGAGEFGGPGGEAGAMAAALRGTLGGGEAMSRATSLGGSEGEGNGNGPAVGVGTRGRGGGRGKLV